MGRNWGKGPMASIYFPFLEVTERTSWKTNQISLGHSSNRGVIVYPNIRMKVEIKNYLWKSLKFPHNYTTRSFVYIACHQFLSLLVKASLGPVIYYFISSSRTLAKPSPICLATCRRAPLSWPLVRNHCKWPTLSFPRPCHTVPDLMASIAVDHMRCKRSDV